MAQLKKPSKLSPLALEKFIATSGLTGNALGKAIAKANANPKTVLQLNAAAIASNATASVASTPPDHGFAKSSEYLYADVPSAIAISQEAAAVATPTNPTPPTSNGATTMNPKIKSLLLWGAVGFAAYYFLLRKKS